MIDLAPASIADRLHARRPDWVKGSLSRKDSRFLFTSALEHDGDSFVELGTASGFSTALLAEAGRIRQETDRIADDWRVWSYDCEQEVYFDPSRSVGDAARALLDPDVLDRVEFRSPAMAVDAARAHEPDSVTFLFIDANHGHPWPALDMLAFLDVLAPGAVVVLHDINLPRLRGDGPHGALWLFEGLDLERAVSDGDPPNIGSVVIPGDKAALRRRLLEIVEEHDWEDGVVPRVLDILLPGEGQG